MKLKWNFNFWIRNIQVGQKFGTCLNLITIKYEAIDIQLKGKMNPIPKMNTA